MPTYSYICIRCNKEFEVTRHVDDTSPQKCTSCGSKKTRRVLYSVPIIYKGSGFTKKVEK